MNPRVCPKCQTEKSPSEFNKNRTSASGLSVYCKPCNKQFYQEHRPQYLAQKRLRYAEDPSTLKIRNREQYEKNLVTRMLDSAKRRAKLKGLPFSITKTDIKIPNNCPVLGIPLMAGKGSSKFFSPSLDKIVPSMGYVPGNVIVVSLKANQIKNYANLVELEQVYNFYKERLG